MAEQDENISRDEVRKEFQLERMILFSDAVFAVVITLMAIEIRLPDLSNMPAEDRVLESLKHLIPTFFAYFISFFIIGLIWYNHLKSFRVLKDYDKGLVVRNLTLLFFVGLFPFSATVIVKGTGSPVAIVFYMCVVLFCLSAQYFLGRYILITRPELRIETDISGDLEELEKKKKSLLLFAGTIVLMSGTLFLITNPKVRALAPLWALLFILLEKIMNKKKKQHP